MATTMLSDLFGVVDDSGNRLAKLRDILSHVALEALCAPNDFDMHDDQALSKILLDLARTTVAEELRHMRYLSERPPFKRISLIDDDRTVVSSALLWAQRL